MGQVRQVQDATVKEKKTFWFGYWCHSAWRRFANGSFYLPLSFCFACWVGTPVPSSVFVLFMMHDAFKGLHTNGVCQWYLGLQHSHQKRVRYHVFTASYEPHCPLDFWQIDVWATPVNGKCNAKVSSKWHTTQGSALSITMTASSPFRYNSVLCSTWAVYSTHIQGETQF